MRSSYGQPGRSHRDGRPDNGGMETKRTRFKWQWAEAKVADLRKQEDGWRAQSIPSANWRRVRGKMTALDTLGRERRKFEALAARLKAQGV